MRACFVVSVSMLAAIGAPALADTVTAALGTGKAQVIYIPDFLNSKVGARSGAGGVSVTATEDPGLSFSATIGAGKRIGKRAVPSVDGLVGIGGDGESGNAYVGFSGVGSCLVTGSPGCDARTAVILHGAGDEGALTYVGYGLVSAGGDTGTLPENPRAPISLWQAGTYFGVDPTATSVLRGYKVGNVTATYSGGFIGVAVDVGGQDHFATTLGLSGDVTLTANFKKGSVTGVVDDITASGTLFGDVDLDQRIAIKGTIKGAEYNGTATVINRRNDRAAGRTTSSAVNGTFFGPAADETAGAVRVESRFNPTYNGGFSLTTGGTAAAAIAITGAYGAKQTSGPAAP